MSQHDMNIANGSGLVVRGDLNNALVALASQSSGAPTPNPTFPCQVWADTGTGRLKRRDSANTAWLDMGALDSTLRESVDLASAALDTGAANAYVCAFVPAIIVRNEQQVLRFKASTANTGASTINDGLGTVALVGGAHAALQGGEIVANGDCWAQWNGSIGGSGSYILLFCTGAAEQVAPATKSQHAIQLAQMAAIVGGARNVRMSVTANSATATLTADEVAVKSALGGQAWLLSALSKVINLGTTGAGGMDTGTATANGFVGIYAIYNPATQTSALLATMESGAVLPAVYGGANMPAGYTCSALVSVAPISATIGQFAPMTQTDRFIEKGGVSIISGSGFVGGPIARSSTSAMPYSARYAGGFSQCGSTAASAISMTIFSTLSANVGGQSNTLNVAAGSSQALPFRIPILTPQTLYPITANGAGTPTFTISVSSYEF